MKADFSKIKMLPNQDISIRLTSAHKQTVQNGWDVGLECHSSFELLKVIEGTQHSYFNNHEYVLHKGDIMVLPPKLDHQNICKNTKGLTYFCMHFNLDEPSLKYTLTQSFPIIIHTDSQNYLKIDAVLVKWIQLLDKEPPFDLIDSLTIQLIFTELSLVLAELFIVDYNKYSSPSFFYANQLATLIKNNFSAFINSSEKKHSQLLSINYMIKSIGISQNHAINSFKQVYGISPKKYLDNLKFQEAKLLLEYPFHTVEEISERIGYNSASHFSRQFKMWSNISPLQYRKQTNTR